MTRRILILGEGATELRAPGERWTGCARVLLQRLFGAPPANLLSFEERVLSRFRRDVDFENEPQLRGEDVQAGLARKLASRDAHGLVLVRDNDQSERGLMVLDATQSNEALQMLKRRATPYPRSSRSRSSASKRGHSPMATPGNTYLARRRHCPRSQRRSGATFETLAPIIRSVCCADASNRSGVRPPAMLSRNSWSTYHLTGLQCDVQPASASSSRTFGARFQRSRASWRRQTIERSGSMESRRGASRRFANT